MDDLMSKTDSIAEANRQRAMDEKKNAFLKQKGGYTDEEISNMSPEEKATKLHDVGLNEQSRGVIDEGQNTSRDEDEGFLSKTLNDMKDDLVGAIGVTSDKDGFIDAQGNYHQRTCFTKNTKIVVEEKTAGVIELNGKYFKKIMDIQLQDRVLSWDEKTGTMSFKPVMNLFVRKADLIYKLTFSSGRTVETTWNHPFRVEAGFVGKWIQAKDLKVGDMLKTASPKPVSVVAISTNAREETV
ncbi:MAG: hypothetical protein L6Q54_15855, partial [Leptospiraceae bacterium]|nr:hypothetical protein [Leptospiraceae bacterium]